MIRLFLAAIAMLLCGGVSAEAPAPGILTATGEAVFANQAMPKPRRVQIARRIARGNAQRQLLEVVDGVQIDATTVVKDMALASDSVKAQVSGTLTGAFVLDESQREEGAEIIATVTLGLCISASAPPCLDATTLTAAIQPGLRKPTEEEKFNIPADALPGVAEDTPAAPYTGLILDLRKQGYAPRLDVRLHSPAGKEVYGPGHVKDGTNWLHWASNPKQATAMQTVIGDNPLRLKAQAIGDAEQVILSQADAIKLFTADLQGGAFLAEGKVVLIVKN